jgi:aryl-alcohol dehydrogenase-like predicted oxidoreductase|eukprot:COSAG06_NODE_3197_length_5701_cov_5.984470_5_plen_88_part_00
MQYITLPGTDLRVSRVCLGTQQLSGSAEDETVGADFTWGAVDQATATATVKAAIDAGITFMDCAEAVRNATPPVSANPARCLPAGAD